ncbi:MAG: GFA family protein [Gammaproteobacteria bacterium]|nr:GFA family protein [Gammaproteobacteria bacterium]
MSNEACCLCGSVKWAVSSEPLQAFNCHCSICRKAHGSAFGTYWFVPLDQFRWLGDTVSIVSYRSSPQIQRSFCGTCGSVLPQPVESINMCAVPGGPHDDGKRPQAEIFTRHKAPWFDLTSDLPRFDEYPPDSGMTPVPREALPAAPEGVVRGSCNCGEIRFHVTETLNPVHNCHCSRCRRGRAAAHASNGFATVAAVRFVQGEEQLKSYKMPDAQYFTQVFCNICGSKMPRMDPTRDLAVVPLSVLDDDPGVKPQRHIFVRDKAAWHVISDDLPQFSAAPQ